MLGQSKAAIRLKQMRKQTGLTVRQVADALGKPHSTYAGYEDRFKKDHLPIGLVKELVKIFGVHGVPEDDILQLGGVGKRHKEYGGRHSESLLEKLHIIAELDARFGAGSNHGLQEILVKLEGEAVVAEHGFPAAGFRETYGAPADRVRIVEVVGDSNIPDLWPGQKVMVDTGDLNPSPPGMFVLWDGIGLVIKQVEYIPNSEPPAVRISSRNKHYEPYERTMEEAHIQGRVIGRWGRM